MREYYNNLQELYRLVRAEEDVLNSLYGDATADGDEEVVFKLRELAKVRGELEPLVEDVKDVLEEYCDLKNHLVRILSK